MPGEIEALQRDLKEARENLSLVEERTAEYVLSTDIPLQLVKEKRHLESRIRQLKRRLADQRPIEVLRRATKLVAGPLAEALTGEPWHALRRRLLAQASRLPHKDYLDSDLMAAAADDLIRLTWELRVLLEAHRIEPDPPQLEGLQRHAGRLAEILLRIYRLKPGDAPELEALATGQMD